MKMDSQKLDLNIIHKNNNLQHTFSACKASEKLYH